MADPVSEQPAPPVRRRRRRLWIVLACAAVICILFGRFAYLRITLRPTPRRAYWAAKATALDPAPPGAVSVEEAEVLLSTGPWAGPTTAAFLGQLLSGEWDASRPEIAAARQAFSSPSSRDSRREILEILVTGWADPPDLDLAGIQRGTQGPRNVSYWLLAHSRPAWEELHDTATAAEDWLGALRTARQIRRSQAAWPLIIESSIITATAREMMLAARAGTVLPDTRRLATDIDSIIGPPRGPCALLEGERLRAMYLLDLTFVREGGQWMDVSETCRIGAATMWPMGGAGPSAAPSRLWNLASPVFHDLTEVAARLERDWAEIAQCVDLVACNQVRARTGNNPDFGFHATDGCLSIFGIYWVSTAARLISEHYEAMCSLDAALTMLALEAFRARHGRYPDVLAELIPGYLTRLPIDCADHRPLRYRRTDDGYVLYSIGADGKDDGGEKRSRSAGMLFEVAMPDTDVVFTAIRRQPQSQ